METENGHSNWGHSPAHRFVPGATYIVSAGTYRKVHLLSTPGHLDLVNSELLRQARLYQWNLKAWAVLPNHYHFVASAAEPSAHLQEFIQALHSITAKALNQYDHAVGRRVWYQYFDTCITYEKSYLARLNYVHHNPVKHGIVARAENYRWCSMAWFLESASPGHRRTVLSFPIDRVNVYDDY